MITLRLHFTETPDIDGPVIQQFPLPPLLLICRLPQQPVLAVEEIPIYAVILIVCFVKGAGATSFGLPRFRTAGERMTYVEASSSRLKILKTEVTCYHIQKPSCTGPLNFFSKHVSSDP